MERADEGVSVRLCFGNPGGAAVAKRGEEEDIGDTSARRSEPRSPTTEGLIGHVGCEVRLPGKLSNLPL